MSDRGWHKEYFVWWQRRSDIVAYEEQARRWKVCLRVIVWVTGQHRGQRPDCTKFNESTWTYRRRTAWRVRLIPGTQRWLSSKAQILRRSRTPHEWDCLCGMRIERMEAFTSGLWMIVAQPSFNVSIYPLRW
jgi:hypothetical protein